MKKKLIVALILVLLLSITVGTLTGCDEIFKKNAERDAKQVVATVSYDGQTAYVYKHELESSFNSYSYLYVAYYGMSYEQAADYIAQSLAQRELLVLFAKSELVKAAGIDKVPAMVTVEELLSRSEINRAVENVNEDMLSALNTAIENLINEDNYVDGNDDDDKEEYKAYEGDDVVKVYFDSQEGSTVSSQKIQLGKTAFEPTAPTRDGYTFYGWYLEPECTNKFDFTSALTAESGLLDSHNRLKLYAKWEAYTAPRPVPAEEEADKDADYDPDDNSESIAIAPHFFGADGKLTAEYGKFITDREVKIECLADLSDEEYAAKLDKYLDKAVKEISDNLTKTYTTYDYYLEYEMKSLLITKLERVIGSAATVTASEIETRFAELVAQNKESFAGKDTNYESALTSSLATTYFHKYATADERYGFVANILLKLPQDKTDELIELVTAGVYEQEYIVAQRDEMLKAMTVKVSNPDYDSKYKCDKHTDEEDASCDPMTCPNHVHDDENPLETTTNEGYNQIVDFKQTDGKGGIVYNVKACPENAYLSKEVPAFTTGEQIGIVNQMYASFEKVTAAVNAEQLTRVEGVYWMRELATAWLYLVGDDSGSTSSDSNNGGLGYLITPEGKDSSYIEAFTDQARELIAKGTGSYTVNGEFDGSYVFGDSFIESGSTTNGYAGIFVLVATCVPYDNNGWGSYSVSYDAESGTYSEATIDWSAAEEGVLPLDYIVTYGETLADCKTVRKSVEESILNSKKATLYEEKVNAFGIANYGNIQYDKDAYKSLWKNK